MGLYLVSLRLRCDDCCLWRQKHDHSYGFTTSIISLQISFRHQSLYLCSKVIYYWVLTTKPLEDREFQFVYTCSLLSNVQFIRKHWLKLQFLSWIGQFDKIFMHLCDWFLPWATSLVTSFIVVTDRTFGSAELLLCSSAKMTELFSAEHRTFFWYYIQCQWHPFIFLFCLMTHLYAVLSLVFR